MTEDDEWEQVDIEARPSGSSVISVCMPAQEAHALFAAARAVGLTMSEYVRQCIRGGHSTIATQMSYAIGYPAAGMTFYYGMMANTTNSTITTVTGFND